MVRCSVIASVNGRSPLEASASASRFLKVKVLSSLPFGGSGAPPWLLLPSSVVRNGASIAPSSPSRFLGEEVLSTLPFGGTTLAGSSFELGGAGPGAAAPLWSSIGCEATGEGDAVSSLASITCAGGGGIRRGRSWV